MYRAIKALCLAGGGFELTQTTSNTVRAIENNFEVILNLRTRTKKLQVNKYYVIIVRNLDTN